MPRGKGKHPNLTPKSAKNADSVICNPSLIQNAPQKSLPSITTDNVDGLETPPPLVSFSQPFIFEKITNSIFR
uniref:Uncharacterized protein n=1 Tax=Romanomermis culicivorax TaxID=13658 RepID=A0A915IH73_ROMCU